MFAREISFGLCLSPRNIHTEMEDMSARCVGQLALAFMLVILACVIMFDKVSGRTASVLSTLILGFSMFLSALC